MHPPEGFSIDSNLVCKLKRTLYGPKQAPLDWNKRFDEAVKDLGYVQCKADNCVYVLNTTKNISYLLLFVDGILLASDSVQILETVKIKIMQTFKMRDLGDLKYFFGIKITRSKGVLHMSQGHYLRKVLKKFKMENCAPVKTPVVSQVFQESQSSNLNDSKPYRALIGS